MKKMTAIALGLGLLLGTVSFAQDAKPTKAKTTKAPKGKKSTDAKKM